MNEGFWVNYESRRYIELLCRSVDHEMAIRDPENQAWLGIPPSVVTGFRRFRPRTDRDALLRYVMRRCPLMRIRGHGGIFTTVEFCSRDRHRVLRGIGRWAKRFASSRLLLNVTNLATRKTVRLTVSDLNRYIRDHIAGTGDGERSRGFRAARHRRDDPGGKGVAFRAGLRRENLGLTGRPLRK